MKLTKLVGMLLIAAMVIVSAACNGGSAAPTATKAAPTATTTTQQQPAATATKAPSAPAAAGPFHGIPVPSGATQAQALTSQIPMGQTPGGYENMEWRAYQTGQSLDNLKSFYKSEMSKQGWTQNMWMEGSGEQGEMAWGLFSKGDQDEMAWVYVVPEENDFNLVLMWAGKK